MSDTTTHQLDLQLQAEISQFLYHEAELLDAREFDAWLALLTEDITYRMPVRVTRELKDGSSVDARATYFEDDLTTLTTRLARLGTRSAWAEDPPSRTRHFITNVMVRPGEAPDEVIAESNLFFVRSRGGATENDQLTGRRVDRLRRGEGTWRLAGREVVLDQAVLGTLNLSTIY